MSPRLRWIHLAPCLLAAVSLSLVGCGGSGGESRPAPAPAEFPSAKGKTIDQVLEGSGAREAEVVVSPAAQTFEVGVNRFPFGVFSTGGAQIDDADVALYFAKNARAPVQGPLPARVISLETKPAYRAQGSGEVKTAYVVPAVDFDQSGPWLGIAILKGTDGLEATRLASPTVGLYPKIPAVGEKAPVVHTPTTEEVGGDLEKIDTRVPPDQMHAADFADVVGREPVVLVFATPAFCTSRVCGPVVDIAQQVADQHEGEVEFIHMEVYANNEPPRIRPQLAAYGLRTEPWTFLIDHDGVVRERIEGAYGVAELEEALDSILPG